MTVMSIAFSGLWIWAVHRRLLRGDEAHHMRVRATIHRFGAGLVLYGATIVIALISPGASLVVCGALAVFYVFDQQRTGEPERLESMREPEPAAPGMTSGRK